MTKRFFAASLLALTGILYACGGSDDADATATAAGSPTATFTPASTATVTATPTAESVLATPTPLNSGDPLFNLAGGATTIAPDAAAFRAWPQTSITANGTSYSGVSLADLAAATGATGTFFEVEGIRSDGVRYAIARYATAEFGGVSILVLTDTGQVDFVSSSLEPSQWLTAVSAVTFP